MKDNPGVTSTSADKGIINDFLPSAEIEAEIELNQCA